MNDSLLLLHTKVYRLGNPGEEESEVHTNVFGIYWKSRC